MPTFHVWATDNLESFADEVEATDAEAAVTKWAEETDGRGDFSVLDSQRPTRVRVRGPQGVETYEVEGEAVVVYRARRVGITDPCELKGSDNG